MADGYTTVAALGNLVVHPSHRHCLPTVPVGGAERQRSRTYRRCSTIARDHFDRHTPCGQGSQLHCVGVGVARTGCLTDHRGPTRLDDAHSRPIVVHHRGAYIGDGNAVIGGIA